MSYKITAEVIEQTCDNAALTSGQFAVLTVLASYARDRTRECWPGDRVLQGRTRLGESALRKALRALADDGYIARTRGGHNGSAATWQVQPVSEWPRCEEPDCSTCRPADPALPIIVIPEDLAGEPALIEAEELLDGALGRVDSRPPFRVDRVLPDGGKGGFSSVKGGPQSTPTGHEPVTPTNQGGLAGDFVEALPPNVGRRLSDQDRVRLTPLVVEVLAGGRWRPDELAAYAARGWPLEVPNPVGLIEKRLQGRLGSHGPDSAIAGEVLDQALAADRARTVREGPECEHGTPGGLYPTGTSGPPRCPFCRRAGCTPMPWPATVGAA